MLLAFVSIRRPLSIGCPHRSIGKRLEYSNAQCNRLPGIAAVRSSLRPFGRTEMQQLGCQRTNGAALPSRSRAFRLIRSGTSQPLITAKLNYYLIENPESERDLQLGRWVPNS